MVANLNRRQLIALGSLGLGALASPASAAFASARGFTHNVASGEPSQNSVLLWTRFVADNDTELTVQLSDNAEFGRPKTVGMITAKRNRDHIAKFIASDLPAGRWFYYRFVAPDGSMSAIGRTRTLPEGPTAAFNLGIFSCANMPFGHFNAYAHGAQRGDLDLILHLGDYLYEYPAGVYPSGRIALPDRIAQPDGELIHLVDYRLRYAAYRSDPDLQRLHQLYPMLLMWDDHEFANDAWKGGAQNHQSDSEGDWTIRKAAAEQAYREWLPVADRQPDQPLWHKYEIGDLATIFLTESRIGGRDQPVSLHAALQQQAEGQGDLARILTEFRDNQWLDPLRSMLGGDQEKWLAEALKTSVGSGTKWQVLAQQCVMGEVVMPKDAESWVSPGAPPQAQRRAKIGALAASFGLPLNYDNWDGYPAARNKLLRSAQAAGADLVVLSGDSHNGWAFDLSADGVPAGVEFAGQSVTSPGYEAYTIGIDPKTVAGALVSANAGLVWAETASRGYMSVNLTPDRVTSQWHFLQTIRQKSLAMKDGIRKSVVKGMNRIDPV